MVHQTSRESSTMTDLLVSAGLGAVKAGVFLYDIVSYPFWALYQQPWKTTNKRERIRAKPTGVTEGVCYRNVDEPLPFIADLTRVKICTVEQAINWSVQKYGNSKCLGTRQVIKEHDTVQPDGRVFIKLEMGEYTWITYNEMAETAQHFGRGLRALGHEAKDNLVIFSESRSEWLMSAIGCFKQNVPICTLYATLGEDAIVHGINETEARHVITSHELLPKFKSILGRCPNVTNIIYFKNQLKETPLNDFKDGIIFESFEEVVEKGKTSNYPDVPPAPDDICFIMYTSGSTGAPKGVVISHHNFYKAMTGFANVINLSPVPGEVYMSSLPLAHILELIGESMIILFGGCIGYSSPLTMTDRSSKIKRGCLGDASVLKPTIMVSVPFILDRIYKAVTLKVTNQGTWKKALFDYALSYKLRWLNSGFDTPFCNWFVFRKTRALLGGMMQLVVVGGAPLTSDTHDFIRCVLGSPVLQGYGLTETCSAATVMDMNDLSTGRVGAPLISCDIKLINWEESNYCITDKPYPRGEVIIGGDNIAIGYYKNPEKTEEEFFMKDGQRWFKTGDIGQFEEDGSLRIIDRKKDLVKLQCGEYISPVKVESEMKSCPLVQNICIYADPTKETCVAIVSPVQENLEELAKSMGKEDTRLEALCLDSDINKEILKMLIGVGKKACLNKFELPSNIHLTTEEWTPESDLVTASFKLKRKCIQTRYQDAINRMYSNGIFVRNCVCIVCDFDCEQYADPTYRTC